MEFCNLLALVHREDYGSSTLLTIGIGIHISLLHVGSTSKGNHIAFLETTLDCKIYAVLVISTILCVAVLQSETRNFIHILVDFHLTTGSCSANGNPIHTRGEIDQRLVFCLHAKDCAKDEQHNRK